MLFLYECLFSHKIVALNDDILKFNGIEQEARSDEPRRERDDNHRGASSS
ncbi:hypothetical protein Krac_9649 [Ktedonobacter racemifer DSM 44963]|uniref:Uncharacterized protein n=1 Tax=Ktedonobacter racemifer DSM 44963 TaxID=485913 RepID=D6TCW8_KTERA|nr:hypothetical protein Krac_9649 [Ktedonobacter racemifer DSM 44963]